MGINKILIVAVDEKQLRDEWEHDNYGTRSLEDLIRLELSNSTPYGVTLLEIKDIHPNQITEEL